MIKTKVFLDGRFLSSQSEQSEKFSKIPDWLEKIRLSKKLFCFDHVNRLYTTSIVNLHYKSGNFKSSEK